MTPARETRKPAPRAFGSLGYYQNSKISRSHSKRLCQDEERDPDLYFYDGNIILRVSREDGTLIHFRVHKSVLASEKLADLPRLVLYSVTRRECHRNV